MNTINRTAKEILGDGRIEQAGLREDPAVIDCDNSPNVRITMLSIDQTAAELSRQELAEGVFPEKEDEIAVSEGILRSMGLTGTIGDRIEISFHGAGGKQTGQSREFTIVGMIEDSELSVLEKMYFALISEAFAREILKENEHQYRMYFRMNHIEGKTTDAKRR